MEEWYKIECPSCHIKNWAKESNNFGEDIEAIQCWQCDHKFWLDQEIAMDYYCANQYKDEGEKTINDYLEDAQITIGLKLPDLE